jgi:ABC-type antimicrobial peptide transport system permease subunit
MLAIAGAMALVLGVAGIYGVISYAVAQRRREIGIRIALGAPAHAVTRLFVGHGMVLAGIGVAIGLAAAFAVTRLMASLLFEVSAVDPLTYALVAVTLFGATVLACYVPALRATRVDPIGALRAE